MVYNEFEEIFHVYVCICAKVSSYTRKYTADFIVTVYKFSVVL